MALDLGPVMDAIGARLVGTGLRVADYAADTVNPPQAIVSLPSAVEYDVVAGRGADRAVIPVMVLVGKVSDRAARDLMARYVSGTGAYSVKTAIEGAGGDLDGAAQSVRVTLALPPDVISIAAVEYLGCSFDVEVID